LRRFYDLVRPAGPGWRKIRAESGLPASSDNLPNGLLAALCGAVAVWSALFATGSFLYGNPGRSALEAAMHPAQSDYFYFVADAQGHHRFAKTMEEHDKNVAAYRKAMRNR
jgi:hypothetical protein